MRLAYTFACSDALGNAQFKNHINLHTFYISQ